MQTEKNIQIAADFLFTLFAECENTPEEAAVHTEQVIHKAVELLYPHDTDHKEFREDWIVKYCAYLGDSMEEMIDVVKISRAKRQNALSKK